MPNKKRKALRTIVVEDHDEEQDAGTHAPSTRTRPRKNASRPRKAPRPSVEFVEISSDEEGREDQQRLKGPARGLNVKDVIPPAQPTTEIDVEDESKRIGKSAQVVRHLTRQSQHGKSEANYDMKYHPMDEVTRPKRAARRSTSTSPKDNAETDEESLPSSAIDSDGDTQQSASDSSGDDVEVLERLPDPRATRHSARANKKVVNYSAKHHPQDAHLPGYQHKAKIAKKQLRGIAKRVSAKSELTESSPSTPGPTAQESPTEDGEMVPGSRRQRQALKDDQDRDGSRSANAEKDNDDLSTEPMILSDGMVDAMNSIIEPALARSDESTYTERADLITGSRNVVSTSGIVQVNGRLPRDNIEQDRSENTSDDSEEGSADDLNRIENSALLPNDGMEVPYDGNAAVFKDFDNASDDVDPEPLEPSRRGSHRVNHHLPPSEFDEQLAVTEIQPKYLGVTGSKDRTSQIDIDEPSVSNRKRSLLDDSSTGGAFVHPNVEDSSSASLPSTDRSDSVLDEGEEGVRSGKDSSRDDSAQHGTPITSYKASDHTTRPNDLSQPFIRSGEAQWTNILGTQRCSLSATTPADLPDIDDDLLRALLPSSQQTRPDILIESDPNMIEDNDGLDN